MDVFVERNSSLPSSTREALKIAMPIMVSQFVVMIGGFVSNLLLSRVNATTFAAGLLINGVQMILTTVVFGMLFALSPLVGHVKGEGRDLERIGNLFSAALVVAMLLCVPIIVLLLFISPILMVLRQPPELVSACTDFFRIYIYSVPAIGIISVCVQLLLGILKQALVLLYSLCSLLLATLLGYLLIFGKLGLPMLGLKGLAWAQSITAWTAVLVLGGFVLSHGSHRAYGLLAMRARPVRHGVTRIVKIGLPISVQMGNEILSFFVTTVMVGWLGIAALNMQQVATRYLLLLVIPIVGLSQAATVVASRHFGGGRLGAVKQVGDAYTRLSMIYSLIVLVAFALVPSLFIRVFVADTPENAGIYHMLSIILVLIAVGQIFDAARNTLTGALRGLQDTKFPMIISTILIWPVGVPLAFVMGFALDWGLVGITIAHDVVMMAGAMILWKRWRSRFPRNA
jgi:multidrug resistance protein, MATE family